MNSLNSLGFVPAYTDINDPSYKEGIIDYAKTLNAHDLWSLSGKYGSQIQFASMFDTPNSNKAVLEAIKKEIDEILEDKLTEEAKESEMQESSKSAEEGQGPKDSKKANAHPKSEKKGGGPKNMTPQRVGTRRSARQRVPRQFDDEGSNQLQNPAETASGQNPPPSGQELPDQVSQALPTSLLRPAGTRPQQPTNNLPFRQRGGSEQ
ncbi:hypothetical protein EV356DRAFT_571578 [Viridothelium virens]|uniref:Uncharacterized protein n=1 Tax=Viridothelium virens TaxID=1048519 RepID=A0A6A6GSU6_VIRVR|nr:hypothetical protein EV356DRAFT_571578 [Viridothelium virens]